MTPIPPTPDGRQSLWLLRSQLLLSGSLIVGGGILAIVRTGTLPDHTQPISRLAPGLVTGDGAAWVTLGFLLLILTPAQRLLATAVGFAREKDWRFVGVAMLVLLIIVSGLMIGRH